MKVAWEYQALPKTLLKVPSSKKIKKSEYLGDGIYPIVSQEDGIINGYWNDPQDVIKVDRPVVIFGDHNQLVKFIDFDFVKGADGTKVLSVKPYLEPKFFYYFLLANPIEAIGYARHFRFVKELTVPIPPLEEQKRIVAVLDAAFEGLDRARAHTEANLQNAKDLFASVLEAMLQEVQNGHFTKKQLHHIAKFSQGKQVGVKSQHSHPSQGLVRFIRIVDYTTENKDVRYIENPGDKYTVEKDDVVMVRYGSPGLIGRGISGVIANNLFKIDLQTDAISNDFLALSLSRKSVQDFLSSRGSTTMPAMNFGHLKEVAVVYPSLEEQRKIAQRISYVLEKQINLSYKYKSKLTDLDDFRQSLLQKAFAGELT